MQRHEIVAALKGLGLKGMVTAFDDAVTNGIRRDRTIMEMLGDLLRAETAHRDADMHSSQLDIIVYDTGTYPVFQRVGETVIVPPEGVVAILSVKKTLRDGDITPECEALKSASHICRCDRPDADQRRRGPFLALVGAGSQLADRETSKEEKIFSKLENLYASTIPFDDMIGFIGDLSGWHVFKARPADILTETSRKAKYLYRELDETGLHHGFQFLIAGILSVYYDPTRRNVRGPGYTGFPAIPAKPIGTIPFEALR